MDLSAYVDRIEDSVGDVDALAALRREVAADDVLSADDRVFLDERIGTYLADHDRAGG